MSKQVHEFFCLPKIQIKNCNVRIGCGRDCRVGDCKYVNSITGCGKTNRYEKVRGADGRSPWDQ